MIAYELNTTAVCNPRQNSVQISPRQNSVPQSETKFSMRKNPRMFFLTIFFSDKIFLAKKIFFFEKIFFYLEKILSEKKLSKKNSQIFSWTEFCLGCCLRFLVHFFELSLTNRCLSSLSGICIPQSYAIRVAASSNLPRSTISQTPRCTIKIFHSCNKSH